MNDRNKKNFLEGTTERKIDIVRVGNRVVKTVVTEEHVDNEGVLVRKNIEEIVQADCGHVENVGGQCPVCQRYFCKACVERFGTCFVCGGIACPSCSESTVLEKNKKYHMVCWPESIRRKIFGK